VNILKRPLSEALLFIIVVLALAGVCILVSAPASFDPVRAAPFLSGPTISIPAQIPAQPNDIVSIPISFAANGTSISSVAFGIDYDQTWLSFDRTLPLSITLNLPTGFFGDCQPDITDTDGEIDCIIYDPAPPLSAMPDGVLVTVKLRTLNPAFTLDAAVNFSVASPAFSFGNTQGYSEPGNAIDGSVQIVVPTTITPSVTPTHTSTPTVTPTRTPTPTSTPTFTPTPTGTGTPVTSNKYVFIPLAVHVPSITCSDLIVNSGFEDNSGWEIPATEYTAAYSTVQKHTGLRSMRTGIVYPPDNRYSYSSVRQLVTIPTVFTWVRLYFWRYAISGETVNAPDSDNRVVLPPQPKIGLPFGNSPLNNDLQYVLILDAYNNIRETLVWMLVNQPSWIYQEFLLDDYAGQTIKLQFGTYNDGYDGVSAMYVDDVYLEVCH
jgi:hypothetical protein